MPENNQTEKWIRDERGALVFCSPNSPLGRLTSKSQIIDVFSLKVAKGYERDEKGRLVLLSEPFVDKGRTWSIAKAAQLIRNERNPRRWVALELNKYAWGLFWAGGGIQLCRKKLAAGMSKEASIVPVTADQILKLRNSFLRVSQLLSHH